MIKKYVVVLALLILMILFTSTSIASVLSSKERICERFQENSAVRMVLGRVSKIVSYNDNSVLVDTDKDDGADDDLMDSDGPKENVLLPKIWNLVGEITPDDGNEAVVEGNNLDEASTIDINGKEGATLNDVSTVDENGDVGITNEVTVDNDGETGRTLERVIKIITNYNEKVGTMLQTVVQRIYAEGTGPGDDNAQAIVDTVVVVGGSGGTAQNNKADVVVVTAGNH